MKKIIFLVSSKFSDRDYIRFGFKDLINKGYDVSAWDCLDIIYKNYEIKKDEILSPELNYAYRKHHLKFASKSNLLKHISKIDKNDFFIINFPLQKDNKFIFNYLNKKRLIYGYMMLGILPFQIVTGGSILKYISKINYLIRRIVNTIQSKILFNSVLFKPSFVITAGEIPRLNVLNKYKNTIDIINTHAFDYDTSLKTINKSIDEKLPERYAVFLDENNVAHPDLIYNNAEQVCEPTKYINELKEYFLKFELKTNLPIVIAAHPKGDYSFHYDNFRIVYSLTSELVQKADVVIMQASASINFAVLYKKPIIFLNSKSYIKSYYESINKLASSLDLQPAQIGNNLIDITIPKVVDTSYSLYVNNYIKEDLNDTENIWDKFDKYIHQYLV